MSTITNNLKKRSSRVVRLELVLSAEQVEMAKQEAIQDAARWGGDPGNWRGVLRGIALNAIHKRLPERAEQSKADCQDLVA